MKILLVNSTSFYVMHKPCIPLGLLSIATYLTNNGHAVKICDRAIDGSNINKHLSSFKPDFVGISALALRNFDDAMKVSKAIKKKNIPVVWGGPLPSLIPEIVLENGIVDYVVMGEGEITMLALVTAIQEKTSLYDIDGLAFVKNGKPVVNIDRDFSDLSELPIIDFSFVDPKKYFAIHMSCQKMLHIYSSKGCVSQCTYCYNPYFSKRMWRARPHEYFLSEIKYLVESFGMDGVYFADDLLSPDREHLVSFCESILNSGIDFVWGCDMRVDTCTKENLKLMYDAGCRWIFFGIESGSEERQKKIKKGVNLNKAKDTIDYCTEIGIVSITSFMIGLPDETEDELKQTVDFVQSIKSSIILSYFFGPVPKSELYNYLVDSKKLIAPKTYEDCEQIKMCDQHGLNFSNVPIKELKVISSYFFWRGFFDKYNDNKSTSRVHARKAFKETFEILKRGPLKSLLILKAAQQFLSIVFYTLMFPKIRKKYNLYKSFYK